MSPSDPDKDHGKGGGDAALPLAAGPPNKPADKNSDVRNLSMKCIGFLTGSSEANAEVDADSKPGRNAKKCAGVLIVFAEASKGKIDKADIPPAWLRVVAYTSKPVKDADINPPKTKARPPQEAEEPLLERFSSAEKRKEALAKIKAAELPSVITNPEHRAEFLEGFKGFFVGQADFIQKTLVGAANPDILINAFKMSGPIITGVWTDVLKPAGGFIQDTAAEWWESRK